MTLTEWKKVHFLKDSIYITLSETMKEGPFSQTYHLCGTDRHCEWRSLFPNIPFMWHWQTLWKKVPFPKHTIYVTLTDTVKEGPFSQTDHLCDTDRHCERRSLFPNRPFMWHWQTLWKKVGLLSDTTYRTLSNVTKDATFAFLITVLWVLKYTICVIV